MEVASGYYSNAEAGKILSGDCDEEMGKAKVEEKKEGKDRAKQRNRMVGGQGRREGGERERRGAGAGAEVETERKRKKRKKGLREEEKRNIKQSGRVS